MRNITSRILFIDFDLSSFIPSFDFILIFLIENIELSSNNLASGVNPFLYKSVYLLHRFYLLQQLNILFDKTKAMESTFHMCKNLTSNQFEWEKVQSSGGIVLKSCASFESSEADLPLLCPRPTFELLVQSIEAPNHFFEPMVQCLC